MKRVNEIKERLNQDELERDDMEWLLEQVELIQSHAPEGRNYTNSQYVELLNINSKLNHEIDAYSGKVATIANKLLELEKEMLNAKSL